MTGGRTGKVDGRQVINVLSSGRWSTIGEMCGSKGGGGRENAGTPRAKRTSPVNQASSSPS